MQSIDGARSGYHLYRMLRNWILLTQRGNVEVEINPKVNTSNSRVAW